MRLNYVGIQPTLNMEVVATLLQNMSKDVNQTLTLSARCPNKFISRLQLNEFPSIKM